MLRASRLPACHSSVVIVGPMGRVLHSYRHMSNFVWVPHHHTTIDMILKRLGTTRISDLAPSRRRLLDTYNIYFDRGLEFLAMCAEVLRRRTLNQMSSHLPCHTTDFEYVIKNQWSQCLAALIFNSRLLFLSYTTIGTPIP